MCLCVQLAALPVKKMEIGGVNQQIWDLKKKIVTTVKVRPPPPVFHQAAAVPPTSATGLTKEPAAAVIFSPIVN